MKGIKLKIVLILLMLVPMPFSCTDKNECPDLYVEPYFDIREMKFTEKNGKLSATIYIGEYVRLTIWEEKGVIKGSADTSMLGMMRLVLKKAEK